LGEGEDEVLMRENGWREGERRVLDYICA